MLLTDWLLLFLVWNCFTAWQLANSLIVLLSVFGLLVMFLLFTIECLFIYLLVTRISEAFALINLSGICSPPSHTYQVITRHKPWGGPKEIKRLVGIELNDLYFLRH